MNQLHITSAAIAGALCFAFAVGDLWVFHALPKDTALGFVYLGLGALGLTGAYSAGLHTDPAPASKQPPQNSV